MFNSTSNTYQMKRGILTFSNKISRNLKKPERKFIADMNYGMLFSGSFLLTDIAHQLHEPSRKINIVDRFSKYLSKGTPKDALRSYLLQVKKWCPENVYKKNTMLRKPLFLPTAAIWSASSLRSIPRRRKIFLPSTQ